MVFQQGEFSQFFVNGHIINKLVLMKWNIQIWSFYVYLHYIYTKVNVIKVTKKLCMTAFIDGRTKHMIYSKQSLSTNFRQSFHLGGSLGLGCSYSHWFSAQESDHLNVTRHASLYMSVPLHEYLRISSWEIKCNKFHDNQYKYDIQLDVIN